MSIPPVAVRTYRPTPADQIAAGDAAPDVVDVQEPHQGGEDVEEVLDPVDIALLGVPVETQLLVPVAFPAAKPVGIKQQFQRPAEYALHSPKGEPLEVTITPGVIAWYRDRPDARYTLKDQRARWSRRVR